MLEQQTVQRIIHPADARRRDRRARRGLDPRPAFPQPGQLRDQLRVARDGCLAPQRHAGVGEECLRPRPLLGRRRGALESCRERDTAPTRPIDEIRAHERDVARHARRLAGGRSLPHLDQHPLPFAHDPLDRRIAPGASEMAGIARAEESVRRQSAVHESGAEVTAQRPHPAEHDVAARVRGGVVQLVDLEQSPVLEQPRPEPERRALDDQLAAHGSLRQPRPSSRPSVIASGRPTTFE